MEKERIGKESRMKHPNSIGGIIYQNLKKKKKKHSDVLAGQWIEGIVTHTLAYME